MNTLDWSQCSAVERVPGKVSGAWVLNYQHASVCHIRNLAAGASIEDIMEWFDCLDRKQVETVIKFAAHSFDKESAYAP